MRQVPQVPRLAALVVPDAVWWPRLALQRTPCGRGSIFSGTRRATQYFVDATSITYRFLLTSGKVLDMLNFSKAELLTIGVSIVALSVSIFNAIDTHASIDLQKQALQASDQRWRDEGPNFTLGSEVAIVTPEEKVTNWQFISAGSNVATDKITAASSLYVDVTAINSGRFTGGIMEVGYYKGENDRVPLNSVGCLPVPTPSANGGINSACRLPYKLEVAGGVQFFINLQGFLEGDFQCNEYMKRGMKFYVKGVNGAVEDTETHVAVSNSSYCPTVTPPTK